MKRITAIFLLVVFCLYSLIFKTHYCYYAGTLKRYQNDREAVCNLSAVNIKPGGLNFFDTHFTCFSVLRNAHVNHPFFATVHFFAEDVVSPQQELKISFYSVHFITLLIPESDCHGNAVSVFTPLRAPPVC